MKTLILVRHAKSDWAHESIKDLHRPLNERGYQDAIVMSNKLSADIKCPDLFISSTAIRAYTTASMFASSFGYSREDILITEKIYEASTDSILSVLSAIDKKHNSVIIFGHNPGFTQLFEEISDSYLDNLPTCGILAIQFDFKDWSEILHERGKCILSLFPKEFKQ